MDSEGIEPLTTAVRTRRSRGVDGFLGVEHHARQERYLWTYDFISFRCCFNKYKISISLSLNPRTSNVAVSFTPNK